MLILISISAMLLGLWMIWRLVSINQPEPLTPRNTTWDPPTHHQCRCQSAPLPKQVRADAVRPYFESVDLSFNARARGVVLPKDFVGPTYRSQHPHFWSAEEP